MLNDDIIIGEGNSGNSALTLRYVKESDLRISSNFTSFWVSHAYLNTDLTIFKDTPEGKYLVDNIETATDEELTEWMDSIVIKNIDPELLKSKIDAEIEKSFELGKVHQAHVIKDVLMLF